MCTVKRETCKDWNNIFDVGNVFGFCLILYVNIIWDLDQLEMTLCIVFDMVMFNTIKIFLFYHDYYVFVKWE